MTTDALTMIGAAAAAVAGLAYLIRLGLKAARALDAIQTVVERELEHNHGSSMKDDVHGMARAIGKLQRQVDDLDADYQNHKRTRS